MFSSNWVKITFLVFFTQTGYILAQVGGFDLRDFNSGKLITTSTTFNESTVAFARGSHIFDLTNTSAKTQSYFLTKTEALRNIVAKGDSAYSRFCTSIQCYPTTVFSETLTLKPGESISLIFELDEATKVGYSVIEYKVRLAGGDNNQALLLIFKYNSVVSLADNQVDFVYTSSVYPNPTSSNINLSIDLAKELNTEVFIYNAMSELVYSQNLALIIGKNQVSIPTDNLSSGIYFFTFSNGKNYYCEKFIRN